MDFLEYWKTVKTRLDEEFRNWVPKVFSHFPLQQRETIHHLLESGKRIRGCLTCLMSSALGGKIEAAIPRALAIECIQAASLIHDDYVDGDPVRRDRSALWTVAGPRKAVLLGDVIFATALRNMVEISREDGLVAAEALATLAQGACREFLVTSDLQRGPYQSEPYDLIIHLKTGVLFGAASKLGAIAANASPHLCDLAYIFGARLGEAYQIADDVHDLLIPHEGLEIPAAKLAALAPVLLRFAPETEFPIASLREGKGEEFQAWLQRFHSVLKNRMDDEIKVRLDLARKTVMELPENRYTSMLRIAPVEIMRMMREASSL